MFKKLEYTEISTLELELLCDSNTFNASNWNIDYSTAKNVFNSDFALDFVSVRSITQYIYPDELTELKQNLLNTDLTDIPSNKLGVFNSASNTAFSLLQYFRKDTKNALIITPCYYSYFNMMEEFDYNSYTCSFVNMYSNMEEFLNNILELKINIVIFTEPIFLTNSSIINNQKFISFFELCKMKNIKVLIDAVYNNLDWNDKFKHFLKMYDIPSLKTDNISILESISKKIYFNGLKSALLLSDKKTILAIEQKYNYSSSPFSVGQIDLLKYYVNNSNYFKEKINKLLDIASNNHILLGNILRNSKILIDKCSNGYFTNIHIKKSKFKSSLDDKDICLQLLKNYNLLTIPSSKYFFSKKGYYSFRINLLMSIDKLYLLTEILLSLDSHRDRHILM